MARETVGMSPWLLSLVACPRHKGPLDSDGLFTLRCRQGCSYPVVDGVPVLLVDDFDHTLWVAKASLDLARKHTYADDPYCIDSLGISEEDRAELRRRVHRPSQYRIDPIVSYLVVATCGNAYRHLKGKLTEYPIPKLRLCDGRNQILVDLGCNWGRWTMAAAQKGYRVVGVDPSLGAVMAARRVARELGLQPSFVVGDARHLPLRDSTVDVVFSYSVLQHLSKEDVLEVLGEVKRTLKDGGRSVIQMPSRSGLRCLYQQARRGFRKPTGFDVRYWPLRELERIFGATVGSTAVSVDCFFGIGLQYADLRLMHPMMKMVIVASERLRGLSERFPILHRVADSLFLESEKGCPREALHDGGRSRGEPR